MLKKSLKSKLALLIAMVMVLAMLPTGLMMSVSAEENATTPFYYEDFTETINLGTSGGKHWYRNGGNDNEGDPITDQGHLIVTRESDSFLQFRLTDSLGAVPERDKYAIQMRFKFSGNPGNGTNTNSGLIIKAENSGGIFSMGHAGNGELGFNGGGAVADANSGSMKIWGEGAGFFSPTEDYVTLRLILDRTNASAGTVTIQSIDEETGAVLKSSIAYSGLWKTAVPTHFIFQAYTGVKMYMDYLAVFDPAVTTDFLPTPGTAYVEPEPEPDSGIYAQMDFLLDDDYTDWKYGNQGGWGTASPALVFSNLDILNTGEFKGTIGNGDINMRRVISKDKLTFEAKIKTAESGAGYLQYFLSLYDKASAEVFNANVDGGITFDGGGNVSMAADTTYILKADMNFETGKVTFSVLDENRASVGGTGNGAEADMKEGYDEGFGGFRMRPGTDMLIDYIYIYDPDIIDIAEIVPNTEFLDMDHSANFRGRNIGSAEFNGDDDFSYWHQGAEGTYGDMAAAPSNDNISGGEYIFPGNTSMGFSIFHSSNTALNLPPYSLSGQDNVVFETKMTFPDNSDQPYFFHVINEKSEPLAHIRITSNKFCYVNGDNKFKDGGGADISVVADKAYTIKVVMDFTKQSVVYSIDDGENTYVQPVINMGTKIGEVTKSLAIRGVNVRPAQGTKIDYMRLYNDGITEEPREYTADPVVFSVEDAVIPEGTSVNVGDELEISTLVFNNSSTTPVEAMMLVGVYNEGVLISVDTISTVSVPRGAGVPFVKAFTVPANVDSVKVFIWKGFESMLPFGAWAERTVTAD